MCASAFCVLTDVMSVFEWLIAIRNVGYIISRIKRKPQIHTKYIKESRLRNIPPVSVPPPLSSVQKRRSPSYYRRLKRRRESREALNHAADVFNETSVKTEESLDETCVPEKEEVVSNADVQEDCSSNIDAAVAEESLP